jgi:hypothetical protein
LYPEGKSGILSWRYFPYYSGGQFMKISLILNVFFLLMATGAWALKGKALVITGPSYYQPGNLVLMTLNGPVKTSQTIVTGTCRGPCFSPDGTKIAYLDGNSVVTCNLDGTGKITLCGGVVTTTGLDHCPGMSWSTNGYIYWSEATQYIYRISATTPGTKSIAHTFSDGTSEFWIASVSRDGAKAAARVEPENNVYSIVMGGTEIMNEPGCQASISADGLYVTVASQTHTTAKIDNFGQSTATYTLVAPAPQRYMSNERFSRFSNYHVCVTADLDNPYIIDIRDNSIVSLGAQRGQCWDYYPVADATAPSDVGGLGAAPSGTNVTLSWNAATDAESGIAEYAIFRGLTANPTQVLASVGNVTSFMDDGGLDGRTYYYRVKAKNEVGLESVNYSNEVSAIMPAGTPSTLVLGAPTGTSGQAWSWDTLMVGKNPYTDVSCIFSQVPARFEGYRYLKTANAARTTATQSAIASFTVSQPVTVYVAWDDRAWTPGFTKPGQPQRQGWMATYAFSGYNLFINCGGTTASHSMWSYNFPAGTVTVGAGWDVPEMYSVIVTPQGMVSVDKAQLNTTAVFKAAPNPFYRATTIQFSIASKQHLALDVYNLAGRLVASLLNQEMSPGSYQIPWTGIGLNSGIYIAKLQTKSGILTRTLLLIK